MPLKEFLQSLSLPGTGERKLRTLLLMTETTIEAVEYVEKIPHARVFRTRDFVDLRKAIQASLDRRSVLNACDSEKPLRDRYKAKLDNAQQVYMNVSSDREGFCREFEDRFFKIFADEGFTTAVAQKAFEKSIVGTVQSAERAPEPDKFDRMKRFIELFSASTGNPQPQPEVNPRISEVTGPIRDSFFNPRSSVQTSDHSSISAWDPSHHASQSNE